MAANWGYERLAAHFRRESIDEMKYAEALMERISRAAPSLMS